MPRARTLAPTHTEESNHTRSRARRRPRCRPGRTDLQSKASNMPLGLAGCVRTPSASAAFDVSAPISDGAPVQGVSAVAATRRSRACGVRRTTVGTRKISPLGTYRYGTNVFAEFVRGEKQFAGLTNLCGLPVQIALCWRYACSRCARLRPPCSCCVCLLRVPAARALAVRVRAARLRAGRVPVQHSSRSCALCSSTSSTSRG